MNSFITFTFGLLVGAPLWWFIGRETERDKRRRAEVRHMRELQGMADAMVEAGRADARRCEVVGDYDWDAIGVGGNP